MAKERQTIAFEHVFPAIRGLQAGREFYVAMCPLGLVPKLLMFEGELLAPDLRAQRQLNQARVPVIARYILSNLGTYVFSAITASVDGDVKFVSGNDEDEEGSADLGTLRVSMKAKFLVNDGQHRCAAIAQALSESPSLESETIPIVLFVDQGLERAQQMFADLNRYAIRPTKSLSVLYDRRDTLAALARLVADSVSIFRGLTEFERSTLSARSGKLFTLSAIHGAVEALLEDRDVSADEKACGDLAVQYWEEVGAHMTEWKQVHARKMSSGEVRQDYISGHGLVLLVLGAVGRALIAQDVRHWKARLKKLEAIDWSRSNRKVWEGRAMIGGKVAKARTCVVMTTAVVKEVLGIELTPEEAALKVAVRGVSRGR